MSELEECKMEARKLVGETIEKVRYYRIHQGEDDFGWDWDYGSWHSPPMAVQLDVTSGRSFYAVWDMQIVSYEMKLAEGFLDQEFTPLQKDPSDPGLYDVTDNHRWNPFIGDVIDTCEVHSFELKDHVSRGHVFVPMAIRLCCGREAVWIVAASKATQDSDLMTTGVSFLSDEIMVVFGDSMATSVGLDRLCVV